MNTAIIGTGVYAKGIANLLLHNGASVRMWTEQKPKDVTVPEGAIVSNSFEEVVKGSEIVFILTGSKYTPDIFDNIKDLVTDETIVVLGSKGILDDGKLITDVYEEKMEKGILAVLSGPTFAVDIAALEPLGFTLATRKLGDYKKVKSAFKSIYLEYSSDILGTEMAGSLKNAYAIGSGILGGFGYGASIRSLYITLVLNEMKDIFKSLGADPETAYTLAGVGDLVLTCISQNSRNFTFGSIFSMGTNKDCEDFLKTHTVEGYDNLRVYYALFKEKKIEAPILNIIYEIVSQKKEASALIDCLISNN